MLYNQITPHVAWYTEIAIYMRRITIAACVYLIAMAWHHAISMLSCHAGDSRGYAAVHVCLRATSDMLSWQTQKYFINIKQTGNLDNAPKSAL